MQEASIVAMSEVSSTLQGGSWARRFPVSSRRRVRDPPYEFFIVIRPRQVGWSANERRPLMQFCNEDVARNRRIGRNDRTRLIERGCTDDRHAPFDIAVRSGTHRAPL